MFKHIVATHNIITYAFNNINMHACIVAEHYTYPVSCYLVVLNS